MVGPPTQSEPICKATVEGYQGSYAWKKGDSWWNLNRTNLKPDQAGISLGFITESEVTPVNSSLGVEPKNTTHYLGTGLCFVLGVFFLFCFFWFFWAGGWGGLLFWECAFIWVTLNCMYIFSRLPRTDNTFLSTPWQPFSTFSSPVIYWVTTTRSH